MQLYGGARHKTTSMAELWLKVVTFHPLQRASETRERGDTVGRMRFQR